MTTFELGDRVTFTQRLLRTQRDEPAHRRTVKRWEPATPLAAMNGRTGVIVGRRTLSNGHYGWVYSEDQEVYVGVHYFTAYVVAYDLNRKPVLVLPEHLTPRHVIV